MQFRKAPLVVGVVLWSSLASAQAPVVDIGASANRPADNQPTMQGELYQQLQQLRQEMMQLRGLVEEQGHQLRQLKQQSLDRYIDLDRRISGASPAAMPADESEDTMLDGGSGAVGASAGVSATGGAQLNGAQVGDGASGGSGASAAGLPSATTGNMSAAAAAQPSVSTGNPSSDYAKAYGLVRSRQFAEAIVAFNDYVERYPDDRYTPNAWYWLGELHIAVKPQNLSASTEAFQKLLADYPDNGKVPAAMYKLATVYYLNGQKQKAKEMLTHVIDRYSNTGNSAVQKSREFLRKNF